ncbi:MAG: VOC family protein [Candidatus Sericytochromatia bacterium]
MALDHIFVFSTPDGPEQAYFEVLGLVPTYHRIHVGQGTANVCYAFDNAFIEILWVLNREEAASESIRRMQLLERSRWRDQQTCPFGIAWRSPLSIAPVVTWPFEPPYLPDGWAIDVMAASDDPRQPLAFSFPGSEAPQEWPSERRGSLQRAAGFSTLGLKTLWMPAGVLPAPDIAQLIQALGGDIYVSPNGAYQLELALHRNDGLPSLMLRLPLGAGTF